MKLDERILRDFKIGVFVGVRKSDRGMHTAFFINHKDLELGDLSVLMGGLKGVPAQVREAYEKLVHTSTQSKKPKRRKKN